MWLILFFFTLPAQAKTILCQSPDGAVAVRTNWAEEGTPIHELRFRRQGQFEGFLVVKGSALQIESRGPTWFFRGEFEYLGREYFFLFTLGSEVRWDFRVGRFQESQALECE